MRVASLFSTSFYTSSITSLATVGLARSPHTATLHTGNLASRAADASVVTFTANLAAACLLMMSVVHPLPAAALASDSVSVDIIQRVVDGDTIITNQLGRVRLIGVNAPETVAPAQKQGAPAQCYGAQASQVLKVWLPVGSKVKIETDEAATDKFDRTLAYVYKPTGEFVNGELVAQGYARAMAVKPNLRYAKKFAQLEAEAKQAQRGLWKACTSKDSSPGTTLTVAKPTVQVNKPAATRAASGTVTSAAGVASILVTPASPVSSSSASNKLANPGDSKNCSDFSNYKEAKDWFDKYFPLYGDVAKLDGNSDGIPCEALYKKATK